jgi:threonine aldolase
MNFASDNTSPASAEILAALAAANHGAVPSYGADPITARLRDRLNEVFGTSLLAHPVGTGTAANALALATLVHPYGAVICAEEAHIATDECGAPEFFTGGAKLIALPNRDGKILPAQIDAVVARARDGAVHHVLPEAVSITQATEWGTVYTPDEIAAVSAICRAHGLKLHMDGARFANALIHLGCTPAALSWQVGVDVMSLGATKNGALAAEAVLFFDPAIAEGFERRRKRAGHLWSKLRYLSAQIDAYLDDDLWLRNAGHANRLATRLAEGLTALGTVRVVQKVEANELFVAMPESVIAALRDAGAYFYEWIAVPGVDLPVVRLVTAHSTTAAEVEQFISIAAAASRKLAA